MYICPNCLEPDDKASILPMSIGPCEVCGKTAHCHEVDNHNERVDPHWERES